MCWWNKISLTNRINSVSTCRNITSIIFRHYHVITGYDLYSTKNKKLLLSPNFIDHDNRCHFAGILAAFIGEPPNTDYFEEDIFASELLNNYIPTEEDLEDSDMLIDLLETILTKNTEKKIPQEILEKIKIFASIVTASIKKYKKEKPNECYSIEFLYSLL